jgi:carbohydrate-selective porin OprB
MPRPTWLKEHGVSFSLVSKADLLSKARGGLSDSVATRYRGHVDLVAQIDTERIGLWSGGTIFLAAQNGHGQGISEADVGDVQALSNIDAHSFTQMSEWFLEQVFLEERLRVKVGRQDAGADFACVEFGGEFLNSSFGLIPTAPVPTFPDPALGVSVFADVSDELSVGGGVYAPTPIAWGRIRGTTIGIEVGYSPGSRSLRGPGLGSAFAVRGPRSNPVSRRRGGSGVAGIRPGGDHVRGPERCLRLSRNRRHLPGSPPRA